MWRLQALPGSEPPFFQDGEEFRGGGALIRAIGWFTEFASSPSCIQGESAVFAKAPTTTLTEALLMPGWLLGAALVGVLVMAASPLAAEPPPVPPEVIAKNLAENVLGEQTVKHVTVSSDRRLIDISWESATYKEANSLETSRDLLKSEAQLATGSIMGIMRPQVIRFAILLGKKTLASGELSGEKGFSISYALDLGGRFSRSSGIGALSLISP